MFVMMCNSDDINNRLTLIVAWAHHYLTTHTNKKRDQLKRLTGTGARTRTWTEIKTGTRTRSRTRCCCRA